MKLIQEHEPYYHKNKEIPSVTTILKLLNKPELVEWANFMGMKGINSTEFVKNSAYVGTYVHYIIERICKKKFILYSEIYTMSIGKKKKIINAVNSFKLWKKEYKPITIHNELKVKNELVGGTIDYICEIDSLKYIVDFKTSKKAYATYFIQLAGYNYLYKKMYNKKIDKVAILILNKNTIDYSFIEMEVDYLEKYYEDIFLILLDLYYKWSDILKYDWNTEVK